MHSHSPATYLQILPATPQTLIMSGRNDPNKDKRSSFLSSGFNSVKRAVSGSRGKKSEKEAEASSSKNLGASNPFADPPPAYSVSPAEGSSNNAQEDPAQKGPTRTRSIYSLLRSPSSKLEENQFRFLAEFDTVFLIDDSGSMLQASKSSSFLRAGSLSRWDQTRNVIEQIVPICMQYDQDGIDVYFLNDPFHMQMNNIGRGEPTWSQTSNESEGKASFGYIGVKDADDVRRIFSKRYPCNATPTGKRLGEIMKTYVNCYHQRERSGQPLPKPLNIIVITDGEATDKDTLTANLIKQAERLDEISAPYHQLGVQFFQVGDDRPAAEFLTGLDNDLGKRRGKEIRDIVDTVTCDELSNKQPDSQLTSDILLKSVLGAVNKHLDNQRIRQGLLVNPD
ncbi:hypothetical protein GGR51DRAFT_501301 [Nemania sp. FL0031]|nr:hypothetical protein GGR51DRAFT_501301 [Nemania sp. FL0031]